MYVVFFPLWKHLNYKKLLESVEKFYFWSSFPNANGPVLCQHTQEVKCFSSRFNYKAHTSFFITHIRFYCHLKYRRTPSIFIYWFHVYGIIGFCIFLNYKITECHYIIKIEESGFYIKGEAEKRRHPHTQTLSYIDSVCIIRGLEHWNQCLYTKHTLQNNRISI